MGLGRGFGAEVENSFVNCESFHIPTERFVTEVPANLAVPCVTYDAGFDRIVEAVVSTVFATRYVLP